MTCTPGTSLSVGPYPITATFSGSGNIYSAQSDTLSQVVLAVAPPPAPTTTTLSVTPQSGSVLTGGTAVTYQATVSTAGKTPTGAVVFYVDGRQLGTAVTTVPIGVGVASATTSSAALLPGAHTIKALYEGDSATNGSEGAYYATVLAAPTATTLRATTSGGSTTASVNGQTVTLTATVMTLQTQAVTAAGTVNFSADGQSLGSAPVHATEAGVGEAVLTTTILKPGSHTLGAAYAGNSTTAASFASTIVTWLVQPSN